MWWVGVVVGVGMITVAVCMVVAPHAWAVLTQKKKQITAQLQALLASVHWFVEARALALLLSIGLMSNTVLWWWFSGSMVMACLGTLLVLLVLPPYVRQLQKKYHSKVCHQLPAFIQALASASRAGLGLQVAFQQLATQSQPPLRAELALCVRELRVGIGLEQVVTNFALRIPHEGTQLLAASVNVSQRCGGRISDVLDRLAHSLRTRFYLEQKVRTLTAQASLQAWVMAAMPLVIAMALSWMQPEWVQRFWDEPLGWAVVMVIVVLETVGLRMMRKIAQITV